jgi:uncharacterized membrane protein
MTEVTLADYGYDLGAFVLALTMIAGYQFYLHTLARRNSAAVLTSAAALARVGWVETVMSDLDNAILAVQTLRSSIMAASFLASTAILLMVGALTLTGEAKSLQATWHLLNFFGTLAPGLWLVKLLCILLLLFFAFFNFINAIRIFNNVGYMVSVHPGPSSAGFSPTMVASELNRGGDFFSVGVRAYYYLVPLIFWLFGPIYMVGSTILLVFVLLPKIDKTPLQFEQGLSTTK